MPLEVFRLLAGKAKKGANIIVWVQQGSFISRSSAAEVKRWDDSGEGGREGMKYGRQARNSAREGGGRPCVRLFCSGLPDKVVA